MTVTLEPNAESRSTTSPMDACNLFISKAIPKMFFDCANNKILLQNADVEKIGVQYCFFLLILIISLKSTELH